MALFRVYHQIVFSMVALSQVGRTQQIVGRERRGREVIADFQSPIVDLIRAAASTSPFARIGCVSTGSGSDPIKTRRACRSRRYRSAY